LARLQQIEIRCTDRPRREKDRNSIKTWRRGAHNHVIKKPVKKPKEWESFDATAEKRRSCSAEGARNARASREKA